MQPNLNPQNIEARAETLSVDNLIKDVERGKIRVPIFQRGLRWESKDVIDLFDSIYRGYPIGSFLLSRGDAIAEKVTIGPKEINAPKTSALWVVDGQQRITAITIGLSRSGSMPVTPDDPWVIYFDSSTKTFTAPTKDDPIPTSWVPVTELLDAARLSEWVYNWEDSSNASARATVFDAGARLRQYQIPIYIVESDDEKFLRDIFHRINNFGKSLKWSEIHDAIFGHKGEGLSTLDDLAEELQHLGMGKPEKEQLLTYLLAFKGLDVTRSFDEHYRRDENVLKNAVRDVIPIMKRVMNFLNYNAEIPHLRLLPRFTPLPVLTRFFALHSEPSARTKMLLSRWTWRVLVGKAIFDERTLLRRAIGGIKKNEEARVQDLLKLISSQKPQSFTLPSQFDARAAASRIALIGLVSLKPLDFYNGQPIDIAALIENYDINAFRKIVPTNNLLGRSPANRLLSWGKGAAYKDLLGNLIFPQDAEKIYQSHAISPSALKSLQKGENETFLKERKIIIENAVNEFANRLAAWGQTDRPTIEYLINNTEGDN